jgi:hypothetical protein
MSALRRLPLWAGIALAPFAFLAGTLLRQVVFG